jgi:hypothetical protein
VEALPGIEEAIGKFGDYIKSETLADSLEIGIDSGGTKVEWLDGEEIGIAIGR